MTKTYCNKECLMMDWEAKHKELCREDVEERKVKGDSKERTKSKAENLK